MRIRARSKTNIRYSIIDKKSVSFIEKLADKHNLTLAFTAQLVVQAVANGKTSNLDKYIEESIAELKQIPELIQKRIKTYSYDGVEYSLLEVKFLARMVEQFKMDTIVFSFLNVKKALADEFSMKIVRNGLMKFQSTGLIIVNGNTRSRTMTLLNKSFMLVNKAIDDGYLT